MNVGSKKLPNSIASIPFSMYGTSIPDLCITKKLFNANGCAMTTVIEKDYDDDDDSGYFINTATFEFKTTHFALQPTAKQMWNMSRWGYYSEGIAGWASC